MFELLLDPGFWVSLFSVTLVQVALGADNLIIITILANKLPGPKRRRAVRLGLILAMLFRILLLAVVSFVLRYATGVFFNLDDTVGEFRLRVGGHAAGEHQDRDNYACNRCHRRCSRFAAKRGRTATST